MTAETITATAAGTWMLGDLRVNRMGFGAMRLTGTEAFHQGEPRDRDQSIAVLRRAVELGVNHIDTAAFYFSRLRSANELINRALAPYPEDLVIATKVGPGREPDGTWIDRGDPARVRGQVEENLRQLGRDHLDLVYFRVGQDESLAEPFGILAGLREAGLIRHLGVSGVTAGQLAEAQAIAPVVSVQNRYGLDQRSLDQRSSDASSLDQRSEDDVLRVCGRQGIAFVPFFALAGDGRHKGFTQPANDAVIAVARAHGVTPAQVQLAWTLAQGPHVLAIPGTGNPAHLEENIATAALRLTPSDLTLLETAPNEG
jgi:pyridoxine 4-dehydrogenase